MRTASARHGTLLLALCAAFSGASALKADIQDTVSSPPESEFKIAQQVDTKRSLSARSQSQFRALTNQVISADGAWIAAEERTNRGGPSVRVWSTKSNITFNIDRGQNPRISRDSCWVSALQGSLENSENAGAKKNRAGKTLVLLNLQDGSKKTYDSVLSYDVSIYSAYLVYLQSPEAKDVETESSKQIVARPTAKPTATGLQPGTLRVVELETGRLFTWQNVTQYAVHQASGPGVRGTWKENYAYVAFVKHDEQTGRDRLDIAFVGHGKRGWGSGGTYEGNKIEGLQWARDSIRLVFLDTSETKVEDRKSRRSSLYTWHDVRDQSGHRKFTRVNIP